MKADKDFVVTLYLLAYQKKILFANTGALFF